MKRYLFLFSISFFLHCEMVQCKGTDSLLQVIIKKIDLNQQRPIQITTGDSLVVKTIQPKEKVKGFDTEKNMPWIVAIFIGIVTVVVNFTISYSTRKTSLGIANIQSTTSQAIATKQIKASIGTNNRQAWINMLRDSVSEFISKAAMFSVEMAKDKDKIDHAILLDHFEKITFLKSKIILLLNDKPEQKIIKDKLHLLLPEAFKSEKDFNLKEYTDIEKDIYKYTGDLLKIHWKKIEDGE